MRTTAPSPSRRIAAAAGLALLGAGLTPFSASANTAGTGLVISEVYGGGGNSGATYTHDFIELYNPTVRAISVDGLSVQWRSATGTTAATGVTALTGSVPAGKHYLVQESAGTGGSTPPPAPNAAGNIPMGASSGTALLVSGTTAINPGSGAFAGNTAVLDLVGVASNVYEAMVAPGMSNTTSVSRNAVGADTDSNAADFTAGGPSPENSGPAVPTVLEATSPGTQSGQVGTAITPFTLTATGGTSPYTWSATGLPNGVTIAPDGVVSGTPTEAGTSTVTATATDSAAPTAATDDVTFTFTVTAAPAPIPIAEIQGTGSSTPLNGQSVKTQGVVTASYPTGGLNGFYIQTAGSDAANASDAIFVYGGSSGFTSYPALGTSVEVTGQATEAFGATQIVAGQSGVTPIASLGEVTPKTAIPGTDCALPGTACLTTAELNDVREVAEGELFQPTSPWTATDVYDGGPYYSDGTNSSTFRGELGVAAGSDQPLVAPTELIDAQATELIAERKKYNSAHRIILDDASTLTYSTTQNSSSPFPWFTPTHDVRVGSAITFPKPVIFTWGFGTWRIQPQAQLSGDPTGTVDFTQTRPAAPQDVGGDVKLATFNVLNFFPTTGEEFVASGLGTCTYYRDRDNLPITNNQCTPSGPRGAANETNLSRQRDKIVSAINTADADIVSLEELENSVQFNKDRDFAIDALVAALNADAGAGTWAAVPSPDASQLPPLSEQDVIRNGFIYQPRAVALVGESDVLADQSTGSEAFADAREPLAQAFKQVGSADTDAFAVIVNHFKSKGSGTADPFGQGNANDRRILQANALVAFADEFKAARDITRVFLAGDFNAYSQEDPIQVLDAAGYTNLESSSNPDEETYNFDGMIGSLDHVLANAAALADVSAVDVWDINGYESVYYEYSRFNSNATNLYAPDPFRSSDHSPEIVGINVADPQHVSTTITGSAAPIEYGSAGSVTVEVLPATATGTVTVDENGDVLGSATLASGTATVALLAKSLPIGTHTLTLTYAGDAAHEPSTGSVTVTVTKASPHISVDVTPHQIVAKKTSPEVVVTATADGLTPTGTVLVAVDGTSYWASLTSGRAVLELKKFKHPGTYDAAVSYFGDATTKAATVIISFEVSGR